MNGNNWRAAQAQGGGEGGGAAAGAMESGDWRTQLLPDSRQRIVNKIMETLKRHLPVSGHEGVQELKKIAVRFEEKIYSAATSQQDYLRKISLKMLTMETKSQTPMTNSVQPNPASSGQNALGPATSYETTSGPEDSDKEAAEEDDEGVFKEDVVEEVVGTKEQNYVVGHKDNVRVVENEESSSNKVIGRPSVFFK
uniref:Non-recognition-of-BTH n=1 Tax=Solanum tuberosum TaxID=4113 RepID=A0A513RB29_SOLTU|nr:non-recognition-of-BTH [Solanum tuberosum]